MKKIYSIFILIGVNTAFVFAQTPDWSTSVATIFYNNCTNCHHEGGIGPFSLIDYAPAVDNAVNIQSYVNAKKMPPWPADPNYTHFKDEQVLSDYEINTINDWVNYGTPPGDFSLAPIPPVYNGLATMINPDDTIVLPHFPLGTDSDVHRTFVMHSGYTEAKYLNQIEFIPGAPSVDHHAIFYHDSTDVSYLADLAENGPGFTGTAGGATNLVVFAGWNPGRAVISLPPFMGFRIPDSSDYVIAMHYVGGDGVTDSSYINVKYCPVPVDQIRSVVADRLINWTYPSLMDGPLFIPANTVKTFHAQSDTFSYARSLVGFGPHSHLVAKTWTVVMVTVEGDTTKLLSIPQWDFNWQMSYFLTKVMKVPINARYYATVSYDNTTNNANNPSNPPKDVKAGTGTKDEMLAVTFWTMDYHEGDEDIIMDSAYYTSIDNVFDPAALPLKVFPNPSGENFGFDTFLPEHNVSWELTDENGNIIKSVQEKNISKGAYNQQVSVKDLANGIYFLTLQSGNEKSVRKIVVVH